MDQEIRGLLEALVEKLADLQRSVRRVEQLQEDQQYLLSSIADVVFGAKKLHLPEGERRAELPPWKGKLEGEREISRLQARVQKLELELDRRRDFRDFADEEPH